MKTREVHGLSIITNNCGILKNIRKNISKEVHGPAVVMNDHELIKCANHLDAAKPTTAIAITVVLTVVGMSLCLVAETIPNDFSSL
ncbi:hypothetical protein Q3G72_021046 [Acer saccharum]|nr:hypothetical protein Q3G72_021046 [Acer saccharum]